MPDTHDDDLRILRNVDPAAGVTAPESLRAQIGDIPAETAQAPRGRHTRWLLPVAAAAIIATAVGGYALGAQRGNETVTAHGPREGDTIPVEVGTPENPGAPITLDGSTSGVGGGESRTEDSGVSMHGGDMMTSLVGWWGGRQRFVYPNFETVPPETTVYAIDGGTNYGMESLATIATTLGVIGEPATAEGGWAIFVGNQYAAPSVMMYPDGGGSISYTSATPAPWSVCEQSATAQHDVRDSTDDATFQAWQAVLDACLEATPLPTEDQAREAMSLFLIATGVDESTTQISVRPDETSRTLSVTASWVVGENVTTVTSSVDVAATGILSGWGPTGEVVSLGQYEIVTANEAAERLNQSAYGASLVSAPPAVSTYPDYVQPTAPPAVPSAGADVPWGIDEREIVSARLGLAYLTDADGAIFLAPAYEFTDTAGFVWSVTALAESELDTALRGGYWGY